MNVELSKCEAEELYRWLEESDIRYWEGPLGWVQQQLKAWYRSGAPLDDCDCPDDATRNRLHAVFIVDALPDSPALGA